MKRENIILIISKCLFFHYERIKKNYSYIEFFLFPPELFLTTLKKNPVIQKKNSNLNYFKIKKEYQNEFFQPS